MNEFKRTIVEVWPVAADSAGIWLLSGSDALYTTGVPYDSTEHFEVVMRLATFGFSYAEGRLSDVAILHQTSSRENDPGDDPRFGRHLLHTWVAVADAGTGFVLERWRDALPISEALLAEVGNPPTHAPDERPLPRRIDVLDHAVRHLAFLRDYSINESRGLPAAWLPHLARLKPTLAMLFMDEHASVR